MGDTTETKPKQEKCVLCAEDSSSKVIKDKGFCNMMNLLLSSLQVDIKPADMLKLDLCRSCFLKTRKVYDMNDASVAMEKRIEKLTTHLLRKSVRGVEKLNENGLPRVGVQDKIFEQYGEILKTEIIDSDEDDACTFEVKQVKDQVKPTATAITSSTRGGRARRGRKPMWSFETNSRKSKDDDETFRAKNIISPPKPVERPVRRAARKKVTKIPSDSSEDEADAYSDGNSKRKNRGAKRNADDDDEFRGDSSESSSSESASNEDDA